LADEGHVISKYVFWSLGKRASLNFFLLRHDQEIQTDLLPEFDEEEF